MRIGIIGSSGGSSFAELYHMMRTTKHEHEFLVVTDRDCGLETFCKENNIPCERIEEKDNDMFSLKAKQYFDSMGDIRYIILFYSRLITNKLFDFYTVLNIHPALLPAFKGMSSIRQFIRGGAKFLGATLHLVDASIDGGPIIAQVNMPIGGATEESVLNKYSFIQKTYLAALSVHLFETDSIMVSDDKTAFVLKEGLAFNDRCNPSIQDDELLNGIFQLQNQENIEVII